MRTILKAMLNRSRPIKQGKDFIQGSPPTRDDVSLKDKLVAAELTATGLLANKIVGKL